ncbi:hypothetical protein C0993_001527 [Termitomyces sp. T159_Od127]|nr:hypothetical protein C0993_001527 [Termitomyces sp. T159_Od127]
MEAYVGVLPINEEAFWASVIAKWSNACSNLVLLKTELEKAHFERKDEELERKDAEIVTLAFLKDELQEANLTLANEKERLETEFTSNKEMWEKQVAELSSLLDKNKEAYSLDVELAQKVPVLAQEARLVESLKASVATEKREKAALCEELFSAYQQLQKANEMNKLYLDKNKTLLKNLTRSNESLKLRESALNTSLASQRDLTLKSTPTKQEPTSTKPKNLWTTSKQTRHNLFVCSPSRTERTPMSKRISSQPVSQSAPACPSPIRMPEAREKALAKLTDNVLDADYSEVKFRRTVLASAIGGNTQSLIVRVTQSQTALAKTHDISMYLCPALELNPWCPTTPGKHGYMFVGLGQEKTTFEQPHVGLNVFLGKTRSSSQPKEYSYLGVYTAVRVNGLSADEWNLLSHEFKIAYCNATKEKSKDPRTVEAIRAAYDAGELSVPCVRLQCTHFNEGLYDALTAAHLVISPPRPLRISIKRKRDDGDHPAQPKRLAPHEPDVRVIVTDDELY